MIFGVVFSSYANNEEKKFDLYVDFSKVKGLDNQDLGYIRKSAFEAVFSAKIFQLALSKKINLQKDSENYYEIELKIEKMNQSSNDYNLEFSFKNALDNELVNFVKQTNVQRSKVQFSSRVLLYKLIFGQYFDEVENKLIEPKVIPFKKKQNQNKVKSEKKLKKDVIKDKVEKSENVAQVINEKETEASPLPVENDKKEQVEKKPKKSSPKIVKIENFESPNISLVKKSPSNVKKINSGLRWLSKGTFGFGTDNELINSKTNADIDTTIRRFSGYYINNMNIEDWYQFAQFGLKLGMVLEEHQFSFSPKPQLFASYNFSVFKDNFFVGPEIEYEGVSYVGLENRGQGLSVYSSKFLWVGAGAKLYLPTALTNISLYSQLKKSMIGSTSFGIDGNSMPIDATKLSLGGRAVLYKNWGLGLQMENFKATSISNNNFELNYSSISLSVTYN